VARTHSERKVSPVRGSAGNCMSLHLQFVLYICVSDTFWYNPPPRPARRFQLADSSMTLQFHITGFCRVFATVHTTVSRLNCGSKSKASRTRGPHPATSRTRGPHPDTSRTRGPHPDTSRTRGPHPDTSRTRGPHPATSRTRGPHPDIHCFTRSVRSVRHIVRRLCLDLQHAKHAVGFTG
jgi:hypothetical protein